MSSTTLDAPHPSPRPWRLAFGERGHDRGHVPVLDGVRAISILLVLAGHLLPLGPSAWALNTTAASMGMSLFFTLSGFLIVRFLWADQRVGPFLVKRFARIVPLATVYAAIMALIVTYDPQTFLHTVTYALNYTRGAVPGTSHLWSLCVEMHFYVGVALAVGLFGRRGLWAVPLCGLLITAYRVEAGVVISTWTHARADEIMAGGTMALALIHLGGAKGDGPAWARHLVWPLAALFFWASNPLSDSFGYLRPYLGTLTVMAVVVAPYSWLRALLSWSVFAYIAKVSYALYVFHGGLRLGWFSEGDKATLYLLKRPLTFALTFAAAHVSTHTLEKWGNDWGRRLIARRYPKVS